MIDDLAGAFRYFPAERSRRAFHYPLPTTH